MTNLTRRAPLWLAGGAVGAGTGLGTVSPAAELPLTLHRGLRIAGDAYNRIRDAWPSLLPGSDLRLLREPDNRHDALAVEVLSRDGTKLGYVPRATNEAAARLMDGGRQVSAAVTRRIEHRHPQTGALGSVEIRYDLFLGNSDAMPAVPLEPRPRPA